ncbi:hypothetical protein AWW68_06130 [Roseivirga spongicola]|uniref:Glycine zipper domain-containing protein n=1 Tax=Roseivirga spongicola TaxID=333140 RepID=A0A150XI31_9BACT|nr:hypothetical protein [Roseivirga spongicola]KYG78342.1 hypothetical protein AWW68_06130 [Roseivirga spongicola]
MKRLPLNLILSLLLLFSVVNCEDRQEDEPIILNKENYQAFADIYSQNLNTIASRLRAASSTFADSKSVISVVENNLEEDVIASFRNNYVNYISDNDRSSTEGGSTQQFNLENLSEIRREYVQEILGSVENYNNPEDYIAWLDNKFHEIYDSEDLELEDKDFLLTYITVYNISLSFLIDNPDLIPQTTNGESAVSPFHLNDPRSGFRDWLDRNLKCVAGVAGSAITVGLGGCAALGQTLGGVGVLGGPAGAASGFATGCIIGGAIGAIGGGLVGYATFC